MELAETLAKRDKIAELIKFAGESFERAPAAEQPPPQRRNCSYGIQTFEREGQNPAASAFRRKWNRLARQSRSAFPAEVLASFCRFRRVQTGGNSLAS